MQKINLRKILFGFLILFMACSGIINSKITPAATNCGSAIGVIFEPLNAIELQGTSTVTIPYVAGFVSEQYPEVTFERIDIYKLENGEKIFVGFKIVDIEIPSTYGFEYLDYSINQHTILYAEPYCKLNEATQEKYICYDDTLKQAIGLAQGNCPDPSIFEFNKPVFDNVFFSLPAASDVDGSHLELDLEPIFGELTDYSDYVLVLDGVFKIDEYLEDNCEREVTIYRMPELAWGSEEQQSTNSQSMTGSIPLGWQKGDGHIHSYYSTHDAYGWICHKVNSYPDIDPNHEIENFTHKVPYPGPLPQGWCDDVDKNVLPSYTIGYKAAQAKMDYIIMTEHSKYHFEPQQTGWSPPNYPDPCKYNNMRAGDPKWFKLYRLECKTAEQEYGIGVIPREEVGTCNNCPEETDCLKQRPFGDRDGHILNYNVLQKDGIRKNGRISDNIWYGKQIVKNKIGDLCPCSKKPIPHCVRTEVPEGVFGWGIIAHPSGIASGGAYGWKHFPNPNKKVEWIKTFDKHNCPSVIRSHLDSVSKNNGNGFFAIEIAGSDSIGKWDTYLFSDVVLGDPLTGHVAINKWNEDGSAIDFDTGNNFVIGVSHSDMHYNNYWQTMEDLQAIKCLKDCVPIPNLELRLIPGFEETGEYLKGDLKDVPFIDKCTYVYADKPKDDHKKFLKQFRSCGKDNKGVTASFGGGWATFALQERKADGTPVGDWVYSGGKIEIAKGSKLMVKVSALTPYKGASNKNYISKVEILGACASRKPDGELKACDDDPKPYWGARSIKTITISTSQDPEDDITDEIIYTIPNIDILKEYDYIRLVVHFEVKRGFILGGEKAYCNPVLIKCPQN
jgi:hypothetical protein